MRSFYRPAYWFFGGGDPFMFWPTFFSLGLITVMGSGFLRNAVPYGWLLVCDEKTTRTDSFLRFRFCQRRHSSVICGDVLVIGFVDLLWRWTPAFWFVDGAPMWRRLLEDVGYGSRTPPIDLYSYSIRCGFCGVCFLLSNVLHRDCACRGGWTQGWIGLNLCIDYESFLKYRAWIFFDWVFVVVWTEVYDDVSK